MTKRTIEIGSTAAGALLLEVDRLVESRALVQANSGGGKSWLLRLLLEATAGKLQALVLDVEGEFATLREKFDFVLVARGSPDKIAPDVRSAALLAKRLLELGVSAIVDLFELKAHDRIRFVRLFLEALIDAPKELRHPTLVVIDEAHLFCPQRGEAESAAAVIDLMTRGRKRGLCGILATQRLSKLHKDAAAEANIKLVGRASLDVDVLRASEELGFSTREDRAALRTLKPGEFFAFGPGLADVVVKFKSGPVATSHPKVGERIGTIAPATSTKVQAVLAKLADLPKEAEAEAKTVDELRARVRELERAAKAAPADPARVRELEEAVKDADARAARMSSRATDWHELASKAEKELSDLLDNHRRRKDHLEAEDDVVVDHRLERPSERIERTRELVANGVKKVRPAPYSNAGGTISRAVSKILWNSAQRLTSGLSTPALRILDGLLFLETIGVDKALRVQAALMGDQSPSSSGFDKNVSTLSSRGFVSYPSKGLLALTAEGRAIADSTNCPQGTEDLHRVVVSKVSGPQGRILEHLISIYPAAAARANVAEATDQSSTSSGFDKNVSRLSSLGLIVYPSKGFLKAADLLFFEASR